MSLNRPVSDWQQQRIWLIGASSGIGAALAEQFLQLGAWVAITARKDEPLQALAARYPQQVCVLAFDVCDDAAWSYHYQQIRQQWQRVDWFIYCAADYQPMRAWQLDASVMRKMMAVNYGAAVQGLQTVLPDMLSRGGGGVVLLASVAGFMGLPKALAYGPTKAALIHLAETLYLDLHPKGLQVSVVNAGFVDTPLTANNDFKMPALQTANQAASAIIKGLSAGEFEIHFPKRFTTPLQLVRRLPITLKLALLARVEAQS